MAVNCAKHRAVCKKQGIEKTPVVRIFPPMPVPEFDIEGEVTTKRIARAAARHVEDLVEQVTSKNLDTWINTSPSVPKVLLFTNKKRTPFMFKALSSAFDVRPST